LTFAESFAKLLLVTNLGDPMKIKVVSDLHLEFSDININNNEGCDVLILSGDIMVAQDLHDHPETDYGMYSNVNLADLGRRQQTALRFRDFLKRCSISILACCVCCWQPRVLSW